MAGSPPRSCAADSDSDDCECDDWTEEDHQLYNKQLDDSDNFDVQFPNRKGSYIGMIGPININKTDAFTDLKVAAELALQIYNRDYKDPESGELQFVKVLKCMVQPSALTVYYLTFDAKDLSTNEVETYQASIFENVAFELKVLSFRRKPSDEEVSRNLPKKWIWKN